MIFSVNALLNDHRKRGCISAKQCTCITSNFLLKKFTYALFWCIRSLLHIATLCKKTVLHRCITCALVQKRKQSHVIHSAPTCMYNQYNYYKPDRCITELFGHNQ